MAVCHIRHVAAFQGSCHERSRCCSLCTLLQGPKASAIFTGMSNSQSTVSSSGLDKRRVSAARSAQNVLAPMPSNLLHLHPDGLHRCGDCFKAAERRSEQCVEQRHTLTVSAKASQTVEASTKRMQKGAAQLQVRQDDAKKVHHEENAPQKPERRRLNIKALIAPTLVGTKVCANCQEEKVVGDFKVFKTSPDGRSYQCRACYAEKHYRDTNQEFPQSKMEGRVCTACERFKPARDFFYDKKEGKLMPRCRSCKRKIELSSQLEREMVPEKKCSLCNETKPASEFSRLRKASSGLLAWCKKCNCQRTLLSYRERPALSEPRVQSKRCGCCKVIKPADAFHGWRKGPDGLQGYCKACSSEIMMSRYYQKAKEPKDGAD